MYLLLLLALIVNLNVANATDLDFVDDSDLKILQLAEKEAAEAEKEIDLSDVEQADDLEALRSDIGDDLLGDSLKKEMAAKEAEDNGPKTKKQITVTKTTSVVPEIFDVGQEEKELLKLSQFVVGKIPGSEWDEISAMAKKDKYVVQEGDWLWKISQRLFGSGFYYSKIWALNPHIKNPHEIEPGMVLVFDTGDVDSFPSVELGEFKEEKLLSERGVDSKKIFDFDEYGDEVDSGWMAKRKELMDQGVYFQFASTETYDDLVQLGQSSLNTEYKDYTPPQANIVIQEPGDVYGTDGFDKTSKISYDFSEGYFLNSFITSNIVVDLGRIDSIPNERMFIQKFDTIFVELDAGANVKPGDKFSIYSAEGKVEVPLSDRSGYRYTIKAQIETVRKINHLWECYVTDISGIVRRGDRVTEYTSKIKKIAKMFSKRNIEAMLIDSYRETANGLSYGDVVYLDRGRADGVELGTIFEVFSFKDRGDNDRKITIDPTYKIGEVTVISISDDFSTGLITNSSMIIELGSMVFSKTLEQAARDTKQKNNFVEQSVADAKREALDELDIDLNLDDLGEDLLNKIDSVQLTEDELEELERQEREKSIIKEHQTDLKELERLENEIVEAEKALSAQKIDEDKYLEQQDLDEIEKRMKALDPNAFEALDEIEKEVGFKYMDEDLNAKENPYGLTEFDLEEIDELLNTGSDNNTSQ